MNRGGSKIFGALFSIKKCLFWPISNAALNFENMLWSLKEGNRKQPFQKGPLFRNKGNRGEKCLQVLVKPYNNDTLQENKKRVRRNLLITPSISSTDLLSSSLFCKIYSQVVSLFPIKIKQLPSAGNVKHFVKNWQKLTNNPIILDTVRDYEIPYTLPPRQSRLPNLCKLAKK